MITHKDVVCSLGINPMLCHLKIKSTAFNKGHSKKNLFDLSKIRI